MCGLAGLVGLDRIGDAVRLADAVDRCLAHRGPDDRDRHYSADGTAVLVHRRLSIIDLTAGGRQPMSSRDGRHWLVYNGEIYNHAELRNQLSAQGVVFRSASDSEVLLEWLLRYGPDGLASVRGMFALAIWDERERELVLARDRFGMKPLYVHWSPDRVAFASEIGALVRSGLVQRSIDPAGVLAYLNWGAISPPLTWVHDVEALMPGTWRRWSASARATSGTFADVRRVWLDGRGADTTASVEELRERTAAALSDSLRAHLVADVPVGVFLSGGIDSGAIVSLARGIQTDLHTYTVSVDDSATDEAPLAARVAEHFGTTHHALAVDSHAIVRDWPSILSHLDQPTGDAINSYCVSRVVRESGVKCVLSGVGGDEAFGGYPSFRRIPRARALARLPRRMVSTMAAGAALATPARAGRVRQIARSEGDVASIYRGLRGLLMPDEIAAFVGPSLQAAPDAWARAAAVDRLTTEALGQETDSAAVARLESCVYMRAQLLRDIDAMSMAHGLEVRMPFVDHELVASVWPALGCHPHLLRHKRLLTRALPSPLPADVTDGPKRGFTLPFSRWMAGPLSDMVRSGMSDLATDGWIAADVPDRLWTTWRAGRAHWSRPWALGVLGRFLRDA